MHVPINQFSTTSSQMMTDKRSKLMRTFFFNELFLVSLLAVHRQVGANYKYKNEI